MSFTYIVKKSKGLNLRISIKNGEVFVYRPYFIPNFFLERFLQEKNDWILKNILKQRDEMRNRKESGVQILSRKTKVQIRKEYLLKKEEARRLVNQKLDYWSKFYVNNHNIFLKWNLVSIKNTKTRWGSCSSKKNLNFSYRILELRPELQDYLIVHELCHLLEMNHGKIFWKTVSLAVSDYKNLRRKMRLG